MRARALLVASLIAASACSTTSEAGPGPSPTAPTSSSTVVTNETEAATPLDAYVEADPLAFADTIPDIIVTPAEDDTRPGDQPGSSPTTTTPGASPAGTSPAGNEPSSGVMSQYTGALGYWGPHDVLFGDAGPQPTVAPGTAPLTGLPGSPPNRPAVVVKIDNSSKAEPQSGLNLADIVVEEEVEWGITRLAAVFHTNDSVVGPVRSGRTTDIAFINALGRPALVYSGANQIIDTLLLRQASVQNYSAARSSGYWRDSSRRAPSNLYANTSSFNHAGSSPPAWFHYRPVGAAAPAGTPTSSISVWFPNTTVEWQWSGSQWLRRQNGSTHNSTDGQVSAANVVVAVVPEVATGLVDSAGGTVPEYVWAGSGPATVFTDGKRIDGTWTRPTLASAAVLTDAAGTVIELTPGRTWVELVVAGGYGSS